MSFIGFTCALAKTISKHFLLSLVFPGELKHYFNVALICCLIGRTSLFC